MTASDIKGAAGTQDRRDDSTEDIRWVWDEGLRDAFRGVLEIDDQPGRGNVRVIYVIPDLEPSSRDGSRP